MKTRGSVLPKASLGASGSGSSYAPIEPGYYVAQIEQAASSTFQAGFKGLSGKFTYLKITPQFRLQNDQETIINRQDWIVGVVDEDGVLFRPDGDDTKPALFAETSFLLSAAGFISEDGETVDLDGFEPELLTGQFVTVKVDNAPYTSRDGSERMKNRVIGVFALKERDIQEFSLFPAPNGMVFASEEDYDTFLELQAEISYGNDPY